MIKEIFSVAVFALMPGSVAAEDWRDEPTRLAAAKTINGLAVHCDGIGFERSPPLDDRDVSAMISVYLQEVPDPDQVFASWILERDKLLSSRAMAGTRARQSAEIVAASASDPRPDSRARSEELYVEKLMPVLLYGLEQCQLGAMNPFFSKLWRGRESADFEQMVRLTFRDLIRNIELAMEVDRQRKLSLK